MLTPGQLPVGSKLVNVNEQISLMPQLSGPHKGNSEGESINVNSPVITGEKHSGLATNFVQVNFLVILIHIILCINSLVSSSLS